MYKNKFKLLTMRFSNGGAQPPAEEAPPADQTPLADQEQLKDTTPPNYDELLKKDRELQSWLDSRITKATETAVANAQQKWQRLNDEKLTEAERLKAMSVEEKAAYFEKKWRESERTRTQAEGARQLEKQTLAMFTEHNIPAELMATIDFRSATAEAVKERVELLAQYEIYPTGTFDEKLTEVLNPK